MIRAATTSDVAEIRAMIRELAAYERAAEHARATEEQLHDALFGDHPAASVLIAQDENTGEAVGYALWFPRFSTWTGTRGGGEPLKHLAAEAPAVVNQLSAS